MFSSGSVKLDPEALQWFLLLRSTGPRALGFSICGSRAQLSWGMWDLPGPGDQTRVPCIGRQILNYLATREAGGCDSFYAVHIFFFAQFHVTGK